MELNPLECGNVQDTDLPGKPVVASINFRGNAKITEVGAQTGLTMDDLEYSLWRSFLAADSEKAIRGSNWRQDDYPYFYIRFFKKSGYWKRLSSDTTEERALLRDIEGKIRAKGYGDLGLTWGRLAERIKDEDPDFADQLLDAAKFWSAFQS